MTRHNDRIITEGFPEGWCVEDRLDENQALLIRKSDFAIGGNMCICQRPAATPTDKWLPIARIIAKGFDLANNAEIEQSPASSSEPYGHMPPQETDAIYAANKELMECIARDAASSVIATSEIFDDLVQFPDMQTMRISENAAHNWMENYFSTLPAEILSYAERLNSKDQKLNSDPDYKVLMDHVLANRMHVFVTTEAHSQLVKYSDDMGIASSAFFSKEQH